MNKAKNSTDKIFMIGSGCSSIDLRKSVRFHHMEEASTRNFAFDFKAGEKISVEQHLMTPIKINASVINTQHTKRKIIRNSAKSSRSFIRRSYGKLNTFGMPFKLARKYRKILIAKNPLFSEDEINQALFDLSRSLKNWILDANCTPGWDHPPIAVTDFDYSLHLEENVPKEDALN